MRRATLALVTALLPGLFASCRDQRSPTGVDRPGAGSSITVSRDELGGSEFDALIANLSPSDEVPPTTSSATGLADIRFLSDDTIEWTVQISNPEREVFVAGHIHSGPAGVNGPVRQLLFSSPGDDSDPIVAAGSAVIGADLAEALRNHPDQFYVNFHTRQFPGGATRGQLAKH